MQQLKQKAVHEIGEHIGLDAGEKMVKDYFDAYPEHAKVYLIGKDIVLKILNQPGCEGMLIATALDENGNKTLVFAGADAHKELIKERVSVDEKGNVHYEEGYVVDRLGHDDNPAGTGSGW